MNSAMSSDAAISLSDCERERSWCKRKKMKKKKKEEQKWRKWKRNREQKGKVKNHESE